MSKATAVLFGIEDEFDVTSVVRLGPGQVKIIIEMRALEGACPACGVLSTRVQDRPIRRIKDLPASGQQVQLWWRKRRLVCAELWCRRRSFTQTSTAIRPRARVSERLRGRVAEAIAGSNRAVSDVAAEYEISWPTAHRALVATAARWLPAPTPTRRLGIDETRFRSVRWLLDGMTWKRSDPWLTSFVDCSRDGPGSLLGLAPGRSGGCVVDWLGEQTEAFRVAVELVVIDPSAPYASGIRRALPQARIAVDKWHLVALANQMVTEVRQRVTRDQLGRRGTTRDPVWVNRRLLLTGADHLTSKQWQRLNATLAAADPTNEIGAAWGVKERLRMLLGEREPSKIRWRLADFYDAAIDAQMAETTRLATTIQTWWPAILVALTENLTNARTEGFNLARRFHGRGLWPGVDHEKVLLTWENESCDGLIPTEAGSTFQVKDTTGFYPRLRVDTTTRCSAAGQAGGVLLTDVIRLSGLGSGLSAALDRWRKPTAVHDPAKVVLDLAVSLALGGDCLADVAVLRAEPGIYGRVASDPTVSRTVDVLAADAAAALKAIDTARAAARARVWRLAGKQAPDSGTDAAHPLVVDVDATLVGSHSEKEQARPTFKKGYGFHPLCAFVDHGAAGTGEPLQILLRPGNAGSNTAADHITVVKAALQQLPGHKPGTRPGRKVLVRADGAGATHALLDWLSGQRLSYSVGFGLLDNTADLLAKIPEQVWTPAYDAHDQVRDGAWVAELTDLMNLTGWPKGMRVIARKERPHPGAQLRLTDIDGLRVTAFATNTDSGQLPDLELRHRRRARAEDRIRTAKDTGLTNLPLHDFAQNQIWCALVTLAADLTAWMQLLALHDHDARRWEPKRLRYRLFTIPAALARTGRQVLLHLAQKAPWAELIADALQRLRALAVPG